MSSRFADGVFIAVDVNGNVCGGANSSGSKLYAYLGTAIKRARKGGRVYRVDEQGVTLVWPEAKTFFLNERHELPPDPNPIPPDRRKDWVCSACGKSSCYGYICYGID